MAEKPRPDVGEPEGPQAPQAIDLQHHIHDLQVRLRALELENQQLMETNGELEASRASLSDLYDFAPVVYLALDSQSRIRAANLTAASMFGRERGSLVGTALSAIVAPEDRTALRAHVQRCLTGRIRVDSELSFVARGRPRVVTQVTSMPHFDDAGNVIGCKTVITDISALKWSQQKLEFLTQASALLGSTFDTAASLAEIARRAVPTLADLCIADLVEPSGEVRRLEVAISDRGRAERLERLRTAPPRANEGTALRWVLRTRAPLLIERCSAGEIDADQPLEHDALVKITRPASLMYVPIVGPAAVRGVLTFAAAATTAASSSGRHYSIADLSTMRDLASHAALAMENGRLFEQAQRANASRHDVLQFVSHDLRNPLMGVMLSAETILRATPEVDRRRSGSQIARISRAAKQMRRMIEDLLDSTSLESGHLSVEIGAHPVRPILEGAMDLLQEQAVSRRVTLVVEVGSDAAIACDRQRVVQVISNLVDNALKFTPPDGRITISAHAVGDNMLFSVADSGSGIPADVRPHVFERYRQASSGPGPGRGLGLYIAKGLVEAQHGSIWVDSREGAGATFSFTLPLASGADADAPSTLHLAHASDGPLPLARRK